MLSGSSFWKELPVGVLAPALCTIFATFHVSTGCNMSINIEHPDYEDGMLQPEAMLNR